MKKIMLVLMIVSSALLTSCWGGGCGSCGGGCGACNTNMCGGGCNSYSCESTCGCNSCYY